jgi:hypothetical protein
LSARSPSIAVHTSWPLKIENALRTPVGSATTSLSPERAALALYDWELSEMATVTHRRLPVTASNAAM